MTTSNLSRSGLDARERVAREIISYTLIEMAAELENRYHHTLRSFAKGLNGDAFPGSSAPSGIAARNHAAFESASRHLTTALQQLGVVASTLREVSATVDPGRGRHVA